MPTGIGSLLYTIVLSHVNLFLGFLQIFATQVLAQRLPQKCADDEDDDHIDEHVAAVIQCRVDPRRGHGHVEEGLGHILCPNGCADDIVHEEACAAGNNGTDEEAVLILAEQACNTEDGRMQR